MITIVAIAIITLVGLLFASMAIAPILIEIEQPRASSRASLVLVEQPARPTAEIEHPEAA